MGVLLKNIKKNNFSKLPEWWSKPIAYDDFLVTKSDNIILIDDIEYYLPKIESSISTTKNKKFYNGNYTFINYEDNYLPKNCRIINSYETNKKKFYGGDYVIDEEKEHFLPWTSGINYSSKDKMKFYGGGIVHEDISMKNLIVEKSIEEITFKNSIRSLANSLKEFISPKDIVANQIDFSKVKLEDLHELFHRHSIDTYSCVQIANDYESLRTSKIRLRAINHRIKIILNKIRQLGRNLKEHFTKNHSFHFKNLDDYHSLNLVNSYIVS